MAIANRDDNILSTIYYSYKSFLSSTLTMDDGSDNGSISGCSDSSSSGSAVVTAVEATANGNDRGSSSSISTEGASSTL